jgi:hypothetical protein
MRFSKIIVVIFSPYVIVAGCSWHSAPPREIMFKPDKYHLNPLPPAVYDAIFTYSTAGWDYTNDSVVVSSSVSGGFLNDSGQPVLRSESIRMSVNGTLVNELALYRGQNIPIRFPESVTWRIDGNDRYPGVNHMIVPDKPIQFFSPKDYDTISLSRGFDISYDAVDADSVEILTACFAKVRYRGHPGDTLQEGGQDHYDLVRNTGRFTIPRFAVDSNIFQQFEPNQLMIMIMHVRGDTVHVGNCIYGFMSDRHYARNFYVKP